MKDNEGVCVYGVLPMGSRVEQLKMNPRRGSTSWEVWGAIGVAEAFLYFVPENCILLLDVVFYCLLFLDQ